MMLMMLTSKNFIHEPFFDSKSIAIVFTYIWNIEMGSLRRKFENENLFDFRNLDNSFNIFIS